MSERSGAVGKSDQKFQIELALLKQNMTAIEHTVISQNAAVKTELSEMNRVLKEIHDKLDKTILDQSIKLTKQEYELASVSKEISKVNGKIAKASGFVSALLMAIVGGLFQWFTPSGK